MARAPSRTSMKTGGMAKTSQVPYFKSLYWKLIIPSLAPDLEVLGFY